MGISCLFEVSYKVMWFFLGSIIIVNLVYDTPTLCLNLNINKDTYI